MKRILLWLFVIIVAVLFNARQEKRKGRLILRDAVKRRPSVAGAPAEGAAA